MSGGSGHSLIVDTLTTTGQVLVIPGLTVNIMCHCMHMQINTHVGNTETHCNFKPLSYKAIKIKYTCVFTL